MFICSSSSLPVFQKLKDVKRTSLAYFTCRASTAAGFPRASDTPRTERSVLPIGFHEVIHFSLHTLTFIPDRLLMSAGGGGGDEVRDWQGIK